MTGTEPKFENYLFEVFFVFCFFNEAGGEICVSRQVALVQGGAREVFKTSAT